MIAIATTLAWSVAPAHAGPAARHGLSSPGFTLSRGKVGTSSTRHTSGVECITASSSTPNMLLDCASDSSQPHHEPSMAVDPHDPDHIVVGANDLPGGACCSSEFYTSFDGGKSWTVGDLPFEAGHNFAADQSVAFDTKHGTVLFASNSYDNGPNGLCDGDVVASVSSDGGLSWNGPYKVAPGQGCIFTLPSVAHDKPWITVDDYPSSFFYGRAYATSLEWTCLEADCDPTLGGATVTTVEAHSDDGGYTWTVPQVISGSSTTWCTAYPIAPACSVDPASWPAVMPDGSVHVAFWNLQGDAAWEPGECCESQFLVVNSNNGGTTWSEPVRVVGLEDGSRDSPNCAPAIGAAFCTLSQSELGVFSYGNLAASPVDGSLYLVFSDNRNGVHDSDSPVTNSDVFLMTSKDGGSTWTGPAVVSDAPGDQFMPFAAVDPASGALGVIFYDRSGDPSTLFDVTLMDGSPGSFVSSRISTQSSHLDKNLWFPAGVPACPRCASWIGEYVALAYGGDGRANVAWTDLRRRVTVSGVGNGYTENIFYAKA
jgi:hypothetical protein